RKEPPMDASAILAEMDMKRQKNTEAARRSRAKKMERLEALEIEVRGLKKEKEGFRKRVEEMEREREEQEKRHDEEVGRLKALLGI
ncbi:hypothetical protein HK097_004951, partial [Rhizophlyctis rosea]